MDIINILILIFIYVISIIYTALYFYKKGCKNTIKNLDAEYLKICGKDTNGAQNERSP